MKQKRLAEAVALPRKSACWNPHGLDSCEFPKDLYFYLSVSPATKNATGVWVSFSLLACQPLWGCTYTIRVGMTGFTLPSRSIPDPDSFRSQGPKQSTSARGVSRCLEYGILTYFDHWKSQLLAPISQHGFLNGSENCSKPWCFIEKSRFTTDWEALVGTSLSTLTCSLTFEVAWESLSARSLCCALSATVTGDEFFCGSGVSL